MLQRLSFIALSGLALALTAVPSSAQSAMRDVLEDMKKGGYVVVIRHGRTNESADTKDASPLDLSNCTGQLMLNEVGKRQAQAIGEAFKKAEVPVGKVIASTYCRAMEMGRLAFGKAEPSDALLLEAFVPAPGTPVPPPWPQRVELMKQLIATDAGGRDQHDPDHPLPQRESRARRADRLRRRCDRQARRPWCAIVVARITAKEWAAF